MMKSPTAPEQSRRQIRVLSASVDLALSRSRVMLLEQFGFNAVYSESKEHALALMEKGQVDVLVFGSSLPRDTCWHLAQVFRSKNPDGKIIEILPAVWASAKNRPDATVLSSDEPDLLPRTIHLLLQ